VLTAKHFSVIVDARKDEIREFEGLANIRGHNIVCAKIHSW
jgi:hypothetical protein